MVYSPENIRFLKSELERLSEKGRQLRESLAELKRRAGLDPDASLPCPEASPLPSAGSDSSPFSPGFFSGRFTA
jgi:hypothetical protein